MAKPRKTRPAMQPWWLTDGTETCPACSQAYAYHTEIRCLDCDGPLCPICVQVTLTTTLEFSCPDCVVVAGRSGDAGESEVAR
jgi:hypothetical protein